MKLRKFPYSNIKNVKISRNKFSQGHVRYVENYKTLLRETEDPNMERYIGSLTRRLDFVDIAILFKFSYRFNVISLKIFTFLFSKKKKIS